MTAILITIIMYLSLRKNWQIREAYDNYVNQDTGVSEKEGVSVFFKNPEGQIFHTYSTFERGRDEFNVAYHFLDIVPKGRDEIGHDFRQFWVRRHDEYSK